MNRKHIIAIAALLGGSLIGYLGWSQYQAVAAEKRAARLEAERQADFALSMAIAAGLHAQAAERLLPRVEDGEAKAQYQLATLLMTGGGTLPARPAEARELFEKAIEQDYTPAATNLGFMLMNGTGGDKDFARAAELFRVEAELGDPIAQNNLGALYAVGGHGLDVDREQAKSWYLKAAELDHPPAQNSLCTMLAEDSGDDAKAYRKAMNWCEKSAEAGFPPAQANLSILLSRAPGFQRDVIEAWVWAAMATHHKNQQGRALLTRVTGLLDDEQLKEARRRFDRRDKPLWQAPDMAKVQ
ncbi:tetratricopeptide repeat protein [Gymnodinialimonas sp.]